MKHYLTGVFYQKILQLLEKNGEWDLLWKVILSDDTLCPLLRRDKIDIYYRGCMIFSLSEDGIIKNPCDFENRLITYDIPKAISAEDFLKYFPYMKQSADLWLGAEGIGIHEREFSQMIFRENNSKKAGDLSDYFIVDMGHQYEKTGRISDLIGLVIESEKKKIVEPVCRLSIIEVKYLDRTFTGPGGIRPDIDDYVCLISNEAVLKEMKQDIEEMLEQSKHLGLYPGLLNKYDKIRVSDEKPELLFVLISRDTKTAAKTQSLKAILNDVSKQYGDKLEDTYIAQTDEPGFSLYADRKIQLGDYYGSR